MIKKKAEKVNIVYKMIDWLETPRSKAEVSGCPKIKNQMYHIAPTIVRYAIDYCSSRVILSKSI